MTAITAGDEHTCALIDATVQCWGSGKDGRLGRGDTTNRGDQPAEMGNNLPPSGTSSTAAQASTVTIEGVVSMSSNAGLVAGGTEVTLTGIGSSDATGVRFGPTPAAEFTVVNDSTITALSPPRPAGLVNVWIDTPSGSNTNRAVTHFAYQLAPMTTPAVTSVSPNIGAVGGAQQVTILGSGFLSATSVVFGQTPATTYTIVNDAKIIATTPARPAGLINVWITNPHGTNPNQMSSWFNYCFITGPAPTVSHMSHQSGPAAGGQTLTIVGTGFTGTLRVDFGPTTATSFTVVNDTRIEVTTPARPPGLVNVWVRTNNGANTNQQSSWYWYT